MFRLFLPTWSKKVREALRRALFCAAALLTAPGALGENSPAPTVATFSIVAFDPGTGELGVAVQSKIVGVGSIVPFAEAGIGAVATQAYANVRYGPIAIQLLNEGRTPAEIASLLTKVDPQAELRQFAIMNADGSSVAFTGNECNSWAGSRTGKNYTVQGNILAGKEVIDNMATAFENTEGVLALRMIAALEAGQAAGGDTRGRQSAALLVVREGWGYAGLNDRFRDIRVDEHETPIAELKRVYLAHRKLFPRPEKKAK